MIDTKGNGGRAVVCDDDPLVLRIVAALLRRNGFAQVELTTSAAEVIGLAEASQPDVIVLDLNLEGESGLTAIPELKKAAPDTQIIVFTGSATMKASARRAGAYAVLDKVSMASASALEEALQAVAH